MAADGFDAFRQMVLTNAALQEELRRAPTERSLFDQVLAIGRERGYTFSEQDLEAAASANRRAWLERWLYQ